MLETRVSGYLFEFRNNNSRINCETCSIVLYRFKLNLSMGFRVRFGSPVTSQTKFYVTTVNSSFQLLSIFCHKELHLRCCIKLELNIVTWSARILKGIRGYCEWSIAAFRVFCIGFLYFISSELSEVNINSLTWIVALL